jgi:SpoVK/Ycf46/Vps4 family AAA+-type ATPase
MNLSCLFLQVARARNLQERRQALRLAARDKRFDPEQQSEIRSMLEESSRPCMASLDSMSVFRPVTKPSDVCTKLQPLSPGEKPVLTAKQESIVEEWILGWSEEIRLREAGIQPPGPLLLSGPTGCGKTMLTGWIAARLKEVRSATILESHRVSDSHFGQTATNLSTAFDAANANAGLLVIEELDALSEKRIESQSGADRENNKTSVALMRLFDSSTAAIIATTNRPDAIDAALLRRFEYKLEFTAPDRALRERVLASKLGGSAPAVLAELPLTESIPLCGRIRRFMVLHNLNAAAALDRIQAAA